MNNEPPSPASQAVALLSAASIEGGPTFLMMTTADLDELLRSSGLDEATVSAIARTAFSEFNAPKLAHLERSWTTGDPQV